jgi:hypothetical protein
MVVRREFLQCAAQMPFSDGHDPVQASATSLGAADRADALRAQDACDRRAADHGRHRD